MKYKRVRTFAKTKQTKKKTKKKLNGIESDAQDTSDQLKIILD